MERNYKGERSALSRARGGSVAKNRGSVCKKLEIKLEINKKSYNIPPLVGDKGGGNT